MRLKRVTAKRAPEIGGSVMDAANGNVDFDVNDEDFKKSSWSKNNPKTCVMVAIKQDGIAVRDSKDADKQTLRFTRDEWNAFVKGVKGGEFDSVL